MKTFLGVPVMVTGQPFGNLYLTERAADLQRRVQRLHRALELGVLSLQG